MTHNKALLSSTSNKQCQLDVESDFSNTLTNEKVFIKLEDAITSEVTDVMLHNTVPASETVQDGKHIILHQHDDAYVSIGESGDDIKVEYDEDDINVLVTKEERIDDIDIKEEELDIKIEEPDVIPNYLKGVDGEPYDVIDPLLITTGELVEQWFSTNLKVRNIIHMMYFLAEH